MGSFGAGPFSTAGVLRDGFLWTWDDNLRCQLGFDLIQQNAPVRVWAEAGSSHSVEVKQDGTLWAWGWDREGQLGDGGGSYVTKPRRVT